MLPVLEHQFNASEIDLVMPLCSEIFDSEINFPVSEVTRHHKQEEIIRGFLCYVFYSFRLPLLIPAHMTSSEIGLWLTYYLNHNSFSLSTKHRKAVICADASMTYGGAFLLTQEKNIYFAAQFSEPQLTYKHSRASDSCVVDILL